MDNMQCWKEDIKRLNYAYLSILRAVAKSQSPKDLELVFGVSQQFANFVSVISAQSLMELVDQNFFLLKLRLTERSLRRLDKFLKKIEKLEEELFLNRITTLEQLAKIKQDIALLKKELKIMSQNCEAKKEFEFCLKKYKSIVMHYVVNKKRIKNKINQLNSCVQCTIIPCLRQEKSI